MISEYGGTFADFIQGFEPAWSVPYLADVARLERLRVRAYHAADCQVLDQHSVLRQLQGCAQLGQLRVRLHPSLATLESSYAVVSVWTAHQADGAITSFNPWHAQGGLVLRQGLVVKVFAIDRGSVTFINRLNQGAGLEMAIADALKASDEFDLHLCLTLLISHDAITHLHLQPEVSP